jgi:hypothetical protein
VIWGVATSWERNSDMGVATSWERNSKMGGSYFLGEKQQYGV